MMELTDENFEKEIQAVEKSLLIDFFADWCAPCSVLGPILEKLEKDFSGKFILTKVNLNNIPQTAQKFGIDRIPTVVLFKKGKAESGFVGLQSEEMIKEWLIKNLAAENFDAVRGAIKDYEEYAASKGFKLNPDRSVVERIVKGLLENEKKYGKKYCPCRRVTGNKEEDQKNVCPCVYHVEEIEKLGHCICGLFVKDSQTGSK